MSDHTRISLIPLLLALICVFAVPVLGAPGEGELGGSVFSAEGEPLGGVELLLGRAGEVRSVQSDLRGRYLFRRVAPGSYLLLATKVGYRATLAQVNTVTAGSLDLTLRVLGEPAPSVGASPPKPSDESWALRLPTRDVLREVGAEEAISTASVTTSDMLVVDDWSRRFNAEVQQWFSMALGAPDTGGNPLDEGRSTVFRLGGHSPDGVEWLVDGGSGRTAAAFEDAALRQVDDESHRLLVNLSVNPDVDNEVDISAWFDQAERTYDPGLEDEVEAGQRRRVWGYGARWSARVGDESDLDLQIGYGAANLDSLRSGSYLAAGGNELDDEYWSALGSVTFSPGRGHRLRLGMRASFFEHGSEDARLALDPALLGGAPVGAGRRGWAVNVFGKESYEIAGPVALDVGLDLHHLGFDEPVSYILPQAGVTYRPSENDTVRAVVMVKFADGGEPIVAEDEQVPTSQMGYVLAWDRQLAGGFMVSVAAALRPYAQERLADDEYVAFDPATHQALFLSDGNARSREMSVRLEKRIRGFHAAAGMRYGEVEGSLLSSLPNDLPSQILAYDHVRFLSTSLRAIYVPSGTRVAVDFQRVANENLTISDGYVAPLTYTSLDMILQQQIYRHLGRGEWSLLVGYQTLLNASEYDGGEEELARLGVPAALRRVRGGISVRF